mmetsp:Transcript_26318/g.78671  ORF Transcript_26318/g.78671 Transcript_26318/m.78671 type:complete len:234 (-) Transcript_26318:1180-1881(-)
MQTISSSGTNGSGGSSSSSLVAMMFERASRLCRSISCCLRCRWSCAFAAARLGAAALPRPADQRAAGCAECAGDGARLGKAPTVTPPKSLPSWGCSAFGFNQSSIVIVWGAGAAPPGLLTAAPHLTGSVPAAAPAPPSEGKASPVGGFGAAGVAAFAGGAVLLALRDAPHFDSSPPAPAPPKVGKASLHAATGASWRRCLPQPVPGPSGTHGSDAGAGAAPPPPLSVGKSSAD